jgi:hypothetical protein
MKTMRKMGWWPVAAALGLAGALAAGGCQNTPVDLSEGPAPLRMPPPGKACDGECYEDSLTGGQIFTMYCAGCHNVRPLAERPFSNYKNVAVHMRVRANLTGKEYAKLVEFMRRWHDVPPPSPPPEPDPKRVIFSQPIPELRERAPGAGEAPGGKPPEELPKPRPVGGENP